MGKFTWFPMVLAGLVGAVIGVVFVAVANLMSPLPDLFQTLVVACVPAFLSGLLGYFLGVRPKKTINQP